MNGVLGLRVLEIKELLYADGLEYPLRALLADGERSLAHFVAVEDDVGLAVNILVGEDLHGNGLGILCGLSGIRRDGKPAADFVSISLEGPVNGSLEADGDFSSLYRHVDYSFRRADNGHLFRTKVNRFLTSGENSK